jgi:hypothetical protein
MISITESSLEAATVDQLQQLGWSYVSGVELSPEGLLFLAREFRISQQ